MTSVLAVVGGGGGQGLVLSVAAAVAHALKSDVERLDLSSEGHERVAEMLEGLRSAHVETVVLSAQQRVEPYWEVIRLSDKPVVIVPRHAGTVRPSISRVLVPLDGDLHTARAVGQMAGRLTDSGSSVAALHVFDETTTPAFWDQAAHARDAWTEEFVMRNLPDGVSLEVRSGAVGAQILESADDYDADLILLGWSRRLAEGHAPTVRKALVEGRVPVMLMATDVGPPSTGEGRWSLVEAPPHGESSTS